MVNMIMILSALIVGLANIFSVRIVKKNFGEVLPFTIIGMVLIEYISQMLLKSFSVSYVFIGVIAILAILILMINRKDKEFLNRINSIGLWGFVIIGLFFLIFDYQRSFSTWDEFSHWGKMVKEMLRLDQFYTVPEARLLIHKDYPPFVPLFELFWCKFSGGYSESSMTLSLHMMEFALFIPFLLDTYINKEKQFLRKIISCVVIFTICIFTILLFDMNQLLPTVYLDIIMPILYATGIVAVLEDDDDHRIYSLCCIILVQTAILLTKQIGIAFSMLIWLLYTIKLVSETRDGNRLRVLLKNIVMSLSSIGIPFIISRTWITYVAGLGIKGQFDLAKLNLGDIVNIIQGNDNTYRQEVFNQYIYEVLHNCLGAGYLKIPYFGATLLTVVALIVAYWLLNGRVNRDCVFLCINIVVGSIGYALTIMTLYLFCFSQYEATNLASFNRYLGTYMIAEFLVLFVVFVKLTSKKYDTKHAIWIEIIAAVVLLILSNGIRLAHMIKNNYTSNPGYEYKQMADSIEEKIHDGEKIICASTNNVTNVYFINYYLCDTIMDDTFLYTDISSLSGDDYNWLVVKEQLDKNHYLYVVDATKELNDSLGYLLEGEFKDKMLYEYQGTKLIEVK